MLRFHENPPFEIQLINRCSSALINKFCMFWCIYVAFEHVLYLTLLKKVHSPGKTAEIVRFSQKKIQKSCPVNLLTFFLLQFLG